MTQDKYHHARMRGERVLRRSQVPSIGNTARQAEEPPSQHPRLPRRRLAQAWRQPGVVLVLLLSDALLAVLVWLAAFELQSIWGLWEGFREGAPQTAVVVGVFAVAVWIGLRSLMGLYPGYGLSSEERLRRHTYSVVGTLAAVSFAIALNLGAIASRLGTFEVVGRLPRLLLALGFVGLLLLSPLVQGLARWGMWRLGFWGRLVVVIGDQDTCDRPVKLL